MDTPTKNITPDTDQAAALQAYLAEQKKKRRKAFLGSVTAVLVLVLGTFAWQNKTLLLGDITRTGATPATATLFIPEYTAGAGDSGLIAIEGGTGLAAADDDDVPTRDIPVRAIGMDLKLKYEPVNALIFNQNVAIFDDTTDFTTIGQFNSVNTSTPGEALISFFSDTAVRLDGGPIFKLDVKINPELPAGTVIRLTAEPSSSESDGVVIGENYAYNSIPVAPGRITVGSRNTLRILYAESIDDTHILVRFSDLLRGIGSRSDYLVFNAAGDPLAVTNTERGDVRSYGQDTVLLTTAPQAAGQFYFVTTLLSTGPAGSDILGNTQGGVDPAYNHVLFLSPGLTRSALSDFGIASAAATDAHTVSVTFTDPVTVASVPANGSTFLARDLTAATALTITAAATAGNTVTLTVTEDLTTDHTYTVSVADRLAANAPQRARDGAKPGLDRIGFLGFGMPADAVPFNISGAEATGPRSVTVSFSENIDQNTITAPATQFVLSGSTVVSHRVDPDFKRVYLTLGSDLDSGRVYTLTVTGVRSYATPRVLSLNVASFAGYRTIAALSAVRPDTLMSLSATQLRVTFSDAVDPATVTPVNVAIAAFGADTDFSSAAFDPEELTVTAITDEGDHRSFLLTTARQVPDAPYFFVPFSFDTASGVKDTQGRFLNLNRVIGFFGFSVPAVTVSAVVPRVVTNDLAQTVRLTGQNLQHVSQVFVGNEPVTITEQPASGLSLAFTLPAAFPLNSYDIRLVDRVGNAQTQRAGLLVSAAETPMRVVSESSKATPFRVPPDGKTQVTLNVLVEDPKGLFDVDSVLIDLTPVGGAPAQSMTKAAGAQPRNQQWYSLVTTVPVTVPTANEPLQLPVEVRRNADVIRGFASIHVTTVTVTSVPPVIDQAFFAPASAPPDGTTPVKLSAQITDADGANTITSVVANLGALGVGFVRLTPVSAAGATTPAATGPGAATAFFESQPFMVPRTTPTGAYTVVLTVQDATGESATFSAPFSVSSTLNGPVMDSQKSYISPRRSVPHDGQTPFALNVFVSDVNGLSDIVSVVADMKELGLSPVTLKRSADAPTTARDGYFIAEGITVPTTANAFVHTITVTATDAAGSSAQVTLQVDVTNEDTLGEPPRILADRAYTTPRVVVNDGKTPFTLQVFVGDDDGDLESVMVNLANIGQVGAETSSDFSKTKSAAPAAGASAATGDLCPTTSKTLVCMQPSVKEGKDGQWFILPDITVRESLSASSAPYTIEVIASDVTGKTTRQEIPLHVNNGDAMTNDAAPPAVVAAVATTASTVEIVFSEELDTSSISVTGKEFAITGRNDIADILPVISATINANGTVVTLTTEAQTAGKGYVVTVSGALRDAVGVPLVSGTGNRAAFSGFVFDDKPPAVEYISATDPNTIEIEFRDALRPSSLRLQPVTGEPQRLKPVKGGAHDFNVEIYESGESSGPLDVLGLQFVETSNILKVTTATQKPGQRYRVNIKQVENASGIAGRVSVNKLIKGFKASVAQRAQLAGSADLNADGKVDFTDFTMFSAVYGTSFANPDSTPASAAGASGVGDAVSASGPVGQPITPTPDATIPLTTPAGFNQ